MKKTFTCRTVVDITVNIDKCVEDFADGNFATIEEYVEDLNKGKNTLHKVLSFTGEKDKIVL